MELSWPWALGFSLLVIVFGVKGKLHLGLTMFAAGLVLLLAGAGGWRAPLETARLTLTNPATQVLLLSIFALEILGSLLKGTGAMQEIITSLGRLTGNRRILTALLPALIGMLTVPGGAIFSAPMVEQAGEEAGLSRARQAAANLWFRHAFYFVYPLFPSLILAAELAGVSVHIFPVYNFSLTAVALLAAYLAVLGGASRNAAESSATHRPAVKGRDLVALFAGLAPLLTVLLLVLVFDLFFPLALAAGIVAALCGRIGRGERFFATAVARIRKIVLPALRLHLVLVVLGIMYFKQSLEYSGVPGHLAQAMLASGLPLILLMFLFPALVGLLTGENAAAVAIVFPLFLPLLNPSAPYYAAQVAFLYFSSAWGHIFTPTHPCFALTNAYFKVNLTAVLRILLVPAAVTAAAAMLQLALLYLVL